MDAYFFVRFLRMMVKILLPIWFISWAVLIPVTTVNTSVPCKDNLDKLTYGNIGPNQQARYAAHLILAWFFTCESGSTFMTTHLLWIELTLGLVWIFYNIQNEMRHFIITRQQHLIEPNHAKSLQANTILITGVPVRYLNQRSLLKLFEDLPGGVKKIWINRNLKELPDLYDRRLAACKKLESAETALLRTAAKLRSKEQSKKGGKAAAEEEAKAKKNADPEAAPIDLETATSIVPRDQRPTHRLGFLPFTGKKVDTIEWAREEIKECNKLLEEARTVIRDEDVASGEQEDQVANQGRRSEESNKKSGFMISYKLSRCFYTCLGFKPIDVVKETTGALKNTTAAIKGEVTGRISGYGDSKYPPLNSAFVTFNKQIGAHLATQVLAHHEPYRMSACFRSSSAVTQSKPLE